MFVVKAFFNIEVNSAMSNVYPMVCMLYLLDKLTSNIKLIIGLLYLQKYINCFSFLFFLSIKI